MSERNEPTLLRHVLWEFSRECPMPTPDDVMRWQRRFPEHADEIVARAITVIKEVLDPDIDGFREVGREKDLTKTKSIEADR